MRTAHLLRTLLIAALAASPVAAAPLRPAGPNPDRFDRTVPRAELPARIDARLDRLARILQLTPEQRQQFDALRRETRDEMRARLDHARTLRAELRESMDAPQPDPQRVGAKMIELRTLRQELGEARHGFVEKLSTMLDERQRQVLDALRVRQGMRHR